MIKNLSDIETLATFGGNDPTIPPDTTEDVWDWFRRWPYGGGEQPSEGE